MPSSLSSNSQTYTRNKAMDQNKEIALNVSRAIMNGEWDKVENLLSDDFQYIGDGNPAINKQQYIGFMRGVLCTGMTNMDMKFLRVIEEGELVAVDYTNRRNSIDFNLPEC